MTMSLLHTAHLTCRADAVEAFKVRLLLHARISRAESGCQRFEVHQAKDNPTLFFLIEVYTDEAALNSHRDSPHYRQFRLDTADWVVDRKWWYWDVIEAA
jgi:(4S)-4-hydroxy-5-phosphonooxypentane-2,3-dione isomerase